MIRFGWLTHLRLVPFLRRYHLIQSLLRADIGVEPRCNTPMDKTVKSIVRRSLSGRRRDHGGSSGSRAIVLSQKWGRRRRREEYEVKLRAQGYQRVKYW